MSNETENTKTTVEVHTPAAPATEVTIETSKDVPAAPAPAPEPASE